ncbi:blue copper domain-containing protein [Marine Group I thaumarchaeote SCGC AAA799-P11]|uniref:Blue copper domain-containing protein n=2 Tax=Marine Group I TaxID=905826 RepID=A0A087S1W3_9ARCH|nr:blue copper domain-containing protein [Marine Group I thaumarchaeote SCGC AAA799-P11]
MNKSLKYIALLAILPLFTVGITTGSFTDAEALKGKGVSSSKYGSSTNICGLQLCSEIPGGKEAWMAEQGKFKPVAPVSEPSEMMEKESTMEEITEADLGSVLRLSRANVPATIPMHQGYYDGGNVYYIITDSSDPTHADLITKNQGWKVELAPLLKNAPESALLKTYMFMNGIKGDGVHGFQGEVFTSTPAQPDVYSALTFHVHVTWNEGATPRVLTSDAMVMEAADNGEITLASVDVVLNMPQIVWPDGQMIVKEDKTLTDETPYGGGQVLDIDTEEMEVTFIAHRGWGPDGKTIYYIVTDATPSGPANMMGVVSSPTSASLIANSAAVDLFQFKNGLTGSGPLGFQAGIAAGAPGDENYSPMWRIFMTSWASPENAQLLETIGDLNAYREAGLIDIGIARPMDSDHIVNCPFVDPFQ